MSDVNQFKKAFSGLAAAANTDTTPTEAEGGPIDQLTDIVIQERLAADGAANSTISATKMFVNVFNFPLKIVRATISTDAAVTPHASNYADFALSVDDGANGSPATAATATSDSDDANPFGTTADVAEDMTLAPANCTIPPGGCLFYAQTKAGSGVQLPARMVSVRLRRA
jgi:hypothetical protein